AGPGLVLAAGARAVPFRAAALGRPGAVHRRRHAQPAGPRVDQVALVPYRQAPLLAKLGVRWTIAPKRVRLCACSRLGKMNMVAATFASSRQNAAHFYVWMAAACAIVAFGGFAPTYWLQVPAGTFVGAPLLHLHAALFSGWTLLLLSQTVLAARGRIGHHRAWGLMGISLATAMVFVGVATAILSLDLGLAANYGDRSRAFFIVPVTAIALFAGFFAAAIVNIERSDIHKRLMLLATISLLPAAVARLFFVLSTGGGPGMRPGLVPPVGVATAMGPGLLVELLIV